MSGETAQPHIHIPAMVSLYSNIWDKVMKLSRKADFLLNMVTNTTETRKENKMTENKTG